MIQPHSHEWYDRLSKMQDGYYYPWKSNLSPINGEDEYLQLLNQLIKPDMVILEVGCGHGQIPIQFAPKCQSMVAYDRVPAYIELAQKSAVAQQISNINFFLADSLTALLESADLPTHLRQFDMVISRRGPLYWVENIRKVAKPGTILFSLNPKESPLPVWNERLPEPLRLANPRTYSRRQSVERRLGIAGLSLHSAWAFEVPEYFATPENLYDKLSWGHTADEVPSFPEVSSILAKIFDEFADKNGLAVTHGRFMWQAVVD